MFSNIFKCHSYESWDSVSGSAQLPQIMDMSLHNIEYSVPPLTDSDISKDLDYNVPIPKNQAVRVYGSASMLDSSDYSVRPLTDLDISPVRKSSPMHQHNLENCVVEYYDESTIHNKDFSPVDRATISQLQKDSPNRQYNSENSVIELYEGSAIHNKNFSPVNQATIFDDNGYDKNSFW